MRTPWALVRRHVVAHWVRSSLTVLAMGFALFLFCFVISIVTTLDKAVTSAAANRLIVQSAVSLFVDLPLDYQQKIVAVPGVETVSKMQWFGGTYQSEENFFAQFAVDHELYFDMYARDMRLVEGPIGSVQEVTGALVAQGMGRDEAAEEAQRRVKASVLEALGAERRGAVIGAALKTDENFQWSVGKQVPLEARIFTKDDGSAWEFVIVGIYEPLKSNMDDRTMFFRWDYFQKTLESYGDGLGVGVYVANLAPGVEPPVVIDKIDALFANGPQRTKTTTESAFQAIFVSMLGNVPLFMGTIGGAIVFAVFFSVVNTMLIAARQRVHEVGILKALGFGNGTLWRLLVAEALTLSLLGGVAGLIGAKGLEELVRQRLGPNLPGFSVEWTTVGLGAIVTVCAGVLAGIAPAIGLSRLAPVDALRGEA